MTRVPPPAPPREYTEAKYNMYSAMHSNNNIISTHSPRNYYWFDVTHIITICIHKYGYPHTHTYIMYTLRYYESRLPNGFPLYGRTRRHNERARCMCATVVHVPPSVKRVSRRNTCARVRVCECVSVYVCVSVCVRV